MKKNIFISLIVVLLLFLSLKSYAQFDRNRVIYLSEYYQQQIMYNPAFTGDRGQPSLGLASRFSKYGDRKPQTFIAFFQGPVERLQGGLGLRLITTITTRYLSLVRNILTVKNAS